MVEGLSRDCGISRRRVVVVVVEGLVVTLMLQKGRPGSGRNLLGDEPVLRGEWVVIVVEGLPGAVFRKWGRVAVQGPVARVGSVQGEDDVTERAPQGSKGRRAFPERVAVTNGGTLCSSWGIWPLASSEHRL